MESINNKLSLFTLKVVFRWLTQLHQSLSFIFGKFWQLQDSNPGCWAWSVNANYRTCYAVLHCFFIRSFTIVRCMIRKKRETSRIIASLVPDGSDSFHEHEEKAGLRLWLWLWLWRFDRRRKLRKKEVVNQRDSNKGWQQQKEKLLGRQRHMLQNHVWL